MHISLQWVLEEVDVKLTTKKNHKNKNKIIKKNHRHPENLLPQNKKVMKMK
tara:strand:- start:337 stop:489 length:153 start_codon:yes stop_codon:yes gene_type:complete